MNHEQVQSDIIPFLRFISEEFSRIDRATVHFNTDLPDLTMDFVPVVLRQVLHHLIQQVISDSLPKTSFTLLASQLIPSYLSLVITFKGIGFVDIDQYRQLLSPVKGELSVNVTPENNTQIQIDLPINNRIGYMESSAVIQLIKEAE